MISVRSPAWSSSSGVGGKGRFGGPPLPWVSGVVVVVVVSSETGPRPGLYENSGLNITKTKEGNPKTKKENTKRKKTGRQIIEQNVRMWKVRKCVFRVGFLITNNWWETELRMLWIGWNCKQVLQKYINRNKSIRCGIRSLEYLQNKSIEHLLVSLKYF